MRRLVLLLVLFALAWSGWWLFASQNLQSSLKQWLEDRRAEGWQAETSEILTSGFPMKLETTLVEPALADPQTSVAFTTPAMKISAPAWWPGYVTVTFPKDEITLASPDQSRNLAFDDARADLRLHPGPALELEQLSLIAGPWGLSGPDGTVMAAQGITLQMIQSETAANIYDLSFVAPAFQPGSIPRAALRIPSDWPVAFDSLELDATVGFDRAFDRTTIEEERPQPRRLDLRLVEALWGELLLRGAAELDVSPEGLLSGEASLQARNWRDMLRLAENAGAFPPELRPQFENILGALARGSGNPEALDVTISLRDGTMFLGFIPLGAAPRLILR